jgi:hypothetical protein
MTEIQNNKTMIRHMAQASLEGIGPLIGPHDRCMHFTVNSRVHVHLPDGAMYSPSPKNMVESAKKLDGLDLTFDQVGTCNFLSDMASDGGMWEGVPGPTGTRLHLGLATAADRMIKCMEANPDNFDGGVLIYITDGVFHADPTYQVAATSSIERLMQYGVITVGLFAVTDERDMTNFLRSIKMSNEMGLRCLLNDRNMPCAIKGLLTVTSTTLTTLMKDEEEWENPFKRQRSISTNFAIPQLLRQASVDSSVVPQVVDDMLAMPPPPFAGPPPLARSVPVVAPPLMQPPPVARTNTMMAPVVEEQAMAPPPLRRA